MGWASSGGHTGRQQMLGQVMGQVGMFLPPMGEAHIEFISRLWSDAAQLLPDTWEENQ